MDDLRPLWIFARAACALALLATSVGVAAGAAWPAELPLLAALAWAITEFTIVLGFAAQDAPAFERRLTFSAFLFVSWAGLFAYLAPEIAWLGIATFAMVVAVSGTLLEARPLAIVVGYASAAHAVAVFGGGFSMHAHDPLGGAMVADNPVGHTSVVLVVSLLVLPMTAVLTYVVGARVRRARGRALRIASQLHEAQDQVSASHEELRQWSAHLEQEVATKTGELEERNRHLSIVNATSFALREAIEDEPAFERALRLVGRLLQARWVQTRLSAEEDTGLSMLVAAEPDAGAPSTTADDLLLQVARSGVAVFSEIEAPEFKVEAGVPAALDGYAVVPLSSKGESFGALAVFGRDRGEWSEAERRLLLLLGREFSATLDHLSLYRAAVERAGREALLNAIGQAMSAIADAEEAVAHGLELAAGQIGALTMSVVASRDGERRPQVVAHVHSRPGARGGKPTGGHAVPGEQLRGAWRAALLAAPALTRDRAESLVLGAGGEATISARLADEGVGTLVVAPMRTAHAASGALVASAPHGVVWERASVELVSRLAELIALRLQSAELARLQRRRIAELAGLAEIGRTVQSTVDLDRLLREFTVAVHKLQPLVAVHLARLSEDGESAEVTTISEPRTAPDYLTTVSTDASHAWFALRQTRVWSRGQEQPPSFLGDEHAHCVVVPLRAKGRVLGVAAMVTPAATTPDEQSLIEQAVAQLALALDNVSLYQQATQRAARIQVLGNLARIVASVVDLREAFDAFAEEVRWLIPFERAVMLRVEHETELIEPYAVYPRDAALEQAGARDLASSAAHLVAAAEGPVLLRRFAPEHAGLDWSAFGDDAVEVAAVAAHRGDAEVAIFALAHAGGYRPEELEVLDEVGQLLAVSIERVQLFERSEHSARHDLLTGLPNYRYLHERLAELERGIRGEDEGALVLLDMDDLKLYNDALGHAAGDRAIELVGREIRAACREADFVARVGGDEFVLLMDHAGEQEAVVVAERVHAALLEAHREIPGAPPPIRVSAGIAIAPRDGTDAESLLQAADRAMYEAKFSGGGRTHSASRSAGGSAGFATGWRRRPNRVVEALVRAATAGGRDVERGAAALAERYATAVAARRGVEDEALPPLQMLVAATAAERIVKPQPGLDREVSLLLLEGLRAEWRNRAPAEAALAEQLAPATVALAWLQLEEPLGAGLDVEEALARLKEQQPDLAPALFEALAEGARSGEMEQRQPLRAA